MKKDDVIVLKLPKNLVCFICIGIFATVLIDSWEWRASCHVPYFVPSDAF